MKGTVKYLIAASLLGAAALSTPVQADEGRYQAYWNGKSYFILDTDHGHMWNYFGDTIQYNGRIDGDDFVSPIKAKIWQQSHGKWVEK